MADLSLKVLNNTKANIDAPNFTGVACAVTAAADTNTTQIATTAFVIGQASSTTPAALGTAAVGTSLKYARADHVHQLPTLVTTLASLSDANIVTPANGQLLQYNSASSKWVNWTPNYLTSFTEADTLATVTGRGATTSTAVTLSGGLTTTTIAGSTTLSITSNTTNALTLDSGSTGAVNLGTNANAKTITIGNTTGATSVVLNSGSGGVTVNQPSTGIFKVVATAVPTTDMMQVTNTGQANITAGVNALNAIYVGGAAAVEAGAIRTDFTPGTTSGGTWNGYRMVPTAASVTGVTMNGMKFDNITAGAGTDNMIYAGTGWDNILNYNGTTVIDGTGKLPVAQITGTLGVAGGGTGATTLTGMLKGNGTSAISAVTSTAAYVTYWSDANTLTGEAQLAVSRGGTGIGTYAIGDMLYASATGTLAKLADVATGNALISGGVGVAPSWGKIGLTTHISGTLAVGNGGTGTTTAPTQGGIIYGSSTTAYASTAAGTAKQALVSNGTSAPTWATLDMSYLPDATFKKSVRVATTTDLGASLQTSTTLTGYSNSQSLACTTTAASTTVTTTSTAGLKVGAVVSTATVQIAAGTTVATIASATTFTVTNRANITTTAITGTGTTATATFAAQTYVPYAVGSSIVITGATPTTYNGTFVVTACTTTSVSWASTETVTATVQGTIAFTIAAGTSITTAFSQTIAALVIDGVTLALNDRVLVKDQTTVGGIAVTANRDNGIYYVSTLGTTSVPWVLTRVLDADTITEIASALVAVDSGTTYGGYLFDNDIKTTDTLGTTAMIWNAVADNGRKLNFFASTTSAELASVISDETGTGSLVFGTSPTISSPTISGAITATGNATLFKPSSDATTAFQIQKSDASVVLDVDTTNKRVGIGKNNPAYSLDVAGDIQTTAVFRSYGYGSSTGLYLNWNTASWSTIYGSATSGDRTTYFAAADGAASNYNFNGNLTATKVYNAVFNDYAEYFLKDGPIEAGDVVIANPNGDGYIKSQYEYDNLVVGVLSDDYAQCIGGDKDKTLEDQERKYAPIGMAGRVRVKTIGDVRKGDLLVSSGIPGVAMASREYNPGTVIGKALESHSGDSIDRIQMLIVNM